jgi:hypothetical protein
MAQPNDLSRSLVALDQDSTVIVVVEMSQSSWLVAGMLPGIERQPRKKLEPSAERLLGLLHRWRDEAVKAGSPSSPPAESLLRPDFLDQGRSGPSDIGAEKAARLDPAEWRQGWQAPRWRLLGTR